jgi:hypothetical protein
MNSTKAVFAETSSKVFGFHGAERLPSTNARSASFSRDLEREPATVVQALPPGSGFRRSFARLLEED